MIHIYLHLFVCMRNYRYSLHAEYTSLYSSVHPGLSILYEFSSLLKAVRSAANPWTPLSVTYQEIRHPFAHYGEGAV